MKKLFTLAFALVFSTGLAFAQDNNSDIDQVGDFSTATVSQVGSMLDATVYQDGSSSQQRGNEAMVSQVGTSNEAYVQQLGEQNNANIDQAGSGNYAEIVGQTGFANDASALQDDDTENSFIYIDQQGDGNAAFYDSYADAEQYNQSGSTINIFHTRVGINDPAGSRMDVVQRDGANNYVKVDGFGNVLDVDVLQEGGDNNQAFVDQDAPALGQPGNLSATITQLGSDNFADVTQSGFGHTSDVMQNGNTNTATVTQSN